WLNGKTIDRIMVAYDHGADAGSFKTYFDDIIISDTLQTLFASSHGIADSLARVVTGGHYKQPPGVTVLPQPAGHTATIKFSDGWKGVGYLTILSAGGTAMGQQLINIEGGQASFPVSHLPGGLYFLRINKGNEVITQKMMVMHE